MTEKDTLLNQLIKKEAGKGAKPMVLLADIDGTLVAADMAVSPKDRAAIALFMDQGHYFSLATGRGRTNAEYHLKALSTNFPAVFSNGALLYDRAKDSVIREYLMPTDGLSGLFQAMTDYYPDVMIQVYTKDDIFLITDNDPADFRVANHVPYQRVAFNTIEGMSANKILFGMQPENCDGGKAIAEACVGERREHFSVVKSQSMYLELTPAGVSKGRMVEYIREHTEALIAVAGDYYNDIEMMRAGDISYTLLTSPPEVRAAADLVLDSRPGEFISLVIADLLRRGESL